MSGELILALDLMVKPIRNVGEIKSADVYVFDKSVGLALSHRLWRRGRWIQQCTTTGRCCPATATRPYWTVGQQ